MDRENGLTYKVLPSTRGWTLHEVGCQKVYPSNVKDPRFEESTLMVVVLAVVSGARDGQVVPTLRPSGTTGRRVGDGRVRR